MSDELQLDLDELTRRLELALPPDARAGRVMGKTAVRDAVIAELACSDAEAERLVETLLLRGFLRFEVDRSRELLDGWVFVRAEPRRNRGGPREDDESP